MAITDLTPSQIYAYFAGIALMLLIFYLMIYIYLGLAFTEIAKKVGKKPYALAWIPIFGPFIIAYRISKAPFWHWLTLPILPVFLIFNLMWFWKMFEAIKKPGWWAILMLIPIYNLAMIGSAAWKGKKVIYEEDDSDEEEDESEESESEEEEEDDSDEEEDESEEKKESDDGYVGEEIDITKYREDKEDESKQKKKK